MAKEYLQINNKLIMVDGKLVEVPSETESSNALEEQSISLKAVRGIVDQIQNSIIGYINGSPKGVVPSLEVLRDLYPQGDTGVYVLESNGKWCYWNGYVWRVGGTYQSHTDFTEVDARLLTLEEDVEALTTAIGSGGIASTVDASMSDTSTNPVQNKAIKAYIDNAIISSINGNY